MELPAALRAPRRPPTQLRSVGLDGSTVLLQLTLVGEPDGIGCPKRTALELLDRHLPLGQRKPLGSVASEGDRVLHLDRAARSLGTQRVRERFRAAEGVVYHDATRRLALRGATGLLVVPPLLRGTLDATLEDLERLERLLREEGLELAELPLAFLWLQRGPAELDPAELDRLLNAGGRPSFVAPPGEVAPILAAVDAVTTLALEDLRRLLPPSS